MSHVHVVMNQILYFLYNLILVTTTTDCLLPVLYSDSDNNDTSNKCTDTAHTVFSGVLPAGNLLILTQNVSNVGNTAVRVIC